MCACVCPCIEKFKREVSSAAKGIKKYLNLPGHVTGGNIL